MPIAWRWNVIQLIGVLALRVPAMRQSAVREVFWRQFNHLGLEPAATIFFRAALLGTVIIAAVINLLSSNSGLAINLLIHAVVREVGPSLTAIFLILRSSVFVAGDVIGMVRRDDLMRMRAMGIDPLIHVFLPRVAALTLACVIVTFYFELTAVVGGIVLASLWLDVSLAGMLLGFIDTLRLVDFFYSLLKSVGFGILLGVVPAVVALHWARRVDDPVAVISRAMMRTLMYVAAFNAVFAYLVYGVLLFGLVNDG